MAGTVVADTIQAASTSTLVLKNGVASTPPTIQDSAGTEIGTFCRAWVNFNGTGTVAIRADFNVTDITDGGNGTYTVNIDNDLPDANYAVVGMTGFLTTGDNGHTSPRVNTLAVGSTQILVYNDGDALVDVDVISVAIFD